MTVTIKKDEVILEANIIAISKNDIDSILEASAKLYKEIFISKEKVVENEKKGIDKTLEEIDQILASIK